MAKAYNTPILIIEDNDEDFHMIRHGLDQAGVKAPVVRLENIDAALSWLEDKASTASIIMLDLNLPGGSGHQVLSAFKKHEIHKVTPIVVLSTSANPKDIDKCYSLGANSYHSKPLETPQFHKIVAELADYWLGKALLMSAAK